MAVITLTAGAGQTYPTPQAAINAIPKDIVATGNRYVVEAAQGEFTGSGRMLEIAGFTTNAACYITVKATQGSAYYQHANVLTNALRYNAANGSALNSSASYSETIYCTAAYTVFDGLQIKATGWASTAALFYGDSTTLTRCIFESQPDGSGVVMMDGANCKVENCVIVNRGGGSKALRIAAGGLIENCTFVSPSGTTGGNAIQNNSAGNITVHNTAIFGFSSIFSPEGTVTADGHNATNIADLGYAKTGTLHSLVYADQFENINADTLDLRLKSTSALVNAGTPGTTSESANGMTRPSGAAYDIGAWEVVQAATSLSLTTDGAGFVGYADTITVSANGNPAGNVTVTVLVDGVSIGTVALNASTSTGTLGYTPAAAGTKSITLTNTGGLANPSAQSFVVSVKPPSGAVTSQPAPDGQNLTITFSTVDAPTSGTATLSPAASNPNGATTTSGVVSLGSGTGTATFTGIPPGNYDAPTINVTNAGGSGVVTGTQPVSILGISGEPEGPPVGDEPAAVRTVALTLSAGLDVNGNSIPAANLTGLKVAVHEETSPDLFTAPVFQSASESTDGAGLMTFSYATALPAGQSVHITILTAPGEHFNGLVVLA